MSYGLFSVLLSLKYIPEMNSTTLKCTETYLWPCPWCSMKTPLSRREYGFAGCWRYYAQGFSREKRNGQGWPESLHGVICLLIASHSSWLCHFPERRELNSPEMTWLCPRSALTLSSWLTPSPASWPERYCLFWLPLSLDLAPSSGKTCLAVPVLSRTFWLLLNIWLLVFTSKVLSFLCCMNLEFLLQEGPSVRHLLSMLSGVCMCLRSYLRPAYEPCKVSESPGSMKSLVNMVIIRMNSMTYWVHNIFSRKMVNSTN